MAQWLIHFGLPEERIVLEPTSLSTDTCLVELINLSIQNNWHNLGILSSDYHLNRINLMFETFQDESLFKERLEKRFQRPAFQQTYTLITQNPSFFPQASKINPIYFGAETILRERSPHLAKLIDQIESTKEYTQTLESERRGCEDLIAGKYR